MRADSMPRIFKGSKRFVKFKQGTVSQVGIITLEIAKDPGNRLSGCGVVSKRNSKTNRIQKIARFIDSKGSQNDEHSLYNSKAISFPSQT
jgi:hypothetical protein